MALAPTVLQFRSAFPELLPDLIGFAGMLILVLMIVALVGIAYKSATGGIEWPEDKEDDDTVQRNGDEWKYS